jgi:gliding motility-associated-like protein
MLHINKSYYLQHDTAICQGYPFNNFGFVLGEQEESGDYTYQLDFITQEGCDSTITLNLSVVDVGVSIDIFESDFCEEGSVTLVANTQLPNLLWSTGETTPSIIVQQSGRYFVNASFGACSAEDAIIIEPCSLQLFIPTAFTPSNQDGLNDYFSIPLPKNHQIIEFEVVIYNRWGEAIFTSKDYNFKWDGKYKGKFIPNQLYTYRIIVVTQNGNDYLFKGTITVL